MIFYGCLNFQGFRTKHQRDKPTSIIWQIFSLTFPLDINECREKLNICQNGACRNLAGTYICDCDSGYQRSADGKECEGKIAHCDLKNCLEFTNDGLASYSEDLCVCLFFVCLLASFVFNALRNLLEWKSTSFPFRYAKGTLLRCRKEQHVWSRHKGNDAGPKEGMLLYGRESLGHKLPTVSEERNW